MYIGLIIIVILLWIRPEYRFLLFYVFANSVLIFLLNVWRLTWADAPYYALNMVVDIAVTLAIGAPVVALFKWIKTRKTGRDKQLDAEMERIRAEIAARDGSPPPASQ
ncbi:MAG: hypothetical protein WDM79_18550 [Terricaulis sp.]